MNALIGKTVPCTNAIVNYEGKVVEEFPFVQIIKIVNVGEVQFIRGMFITPEKFGEVCLFDIFNLLVF